MATRTAASERPSPDALLEAAGREGRGKLKIFLGAAPGVGKTYEMLTQGRRRRLEGIDVVIGVVETHGRLETDALTKGFEIIPKKRSLYKGHVVAEMDLDAILQRHPALVLVDELAHTNAEGSRHPKRYLDVEEILAAGIDVYTTVNIQHIESLNDVVAQITRIHVRETVPDKVLDQAAEIELVDTTSEELLQRLKEGKVYVKVQAERALRHFFSPGNITALRELALRRAAQRVDRDMVEYMQAHAIGGPWPAGEHVLVCINEHKSSAELVRRGRRLADSFKASFTVIYVEASRHLALSEVEKDRVAGRGMALGRLRQKRRRRRCHRWDRLAVQCRAVTRLGQHRHAVPGAGTAERGIVRAAAGSVRGLLQRALLQFLLPAAALHPHHRRSQQCLVVRRAAVRGGDRRQSGGQGARPGGSGGQARRGGRRIVQFHRQGHGPGPAGRHSLGRVVPDRLDAQMQCGDPFAQPRDRPVGDSRRLSARG